METPYMCMCFARRVARALVFLFCCFAAPLLALAGVPQHNRSAAGVFDVTAATGERGADEHSRLPLAVTGRDLSVLVGVPSIIDGTQSHDPGAQLITFRWTVADAPPGSAATLDASDPAPTFIADMPGSYVLQLVVVNEDGLERDRKSTRLNSSHSQISYAVFCLKN